MLIGDGRYVDNKKNGQKDNKRVEELFLALDSKKCVCVGRGMHHPQRIYSSSFFFVIIARSNQIVIHNDDNRVM